MAEEILSKDDVKQMMLMRFAYAEDDFQYIESALSIMYEYGYKEGLEHAAREAGRQFADILGAGGSNVSG
mgnify:CR=1 FL=1